MRRPCSIAGLLVAWLFANGAIWNVVQSVAWVKMIHDYSQTMPVARAVQVTFDGSAPCELCHIAQKAQDAAHNQLPRDANPGGGMERILLLAEGAPTVVLTAPDLSWPGAVDAAGLTRIDAVPVPPPRA